MGIGLSIPFGIVCLVVALHHLGRLAGSPGAAPSAGAHAVMGLGMAAMFVPALDPVPRPVWVAVFVVSGAWFAATAMRDGALAGDPAHHVVGAAAMLFMLLGGHDHGTSAAVDPEHAHHAAGAEGSPALLTTVIALLRAGWFLADVVRTVLRPTGAAPVSAVGNALPVKVPVKVPVRAPVAAHLAMSVAMAVMLLGMS
jgi:hypothetical protein